MRAVAVGHVACDANGKARRIVSDSDNHPRCALGSLIALMRELQDREVVTRLRTLSSGRTIGGIAFTKGPLAYLLKSQMYLGEINHGQSSYPGEHQSIMDKAIFNKVQEILAHNAAAMGYSQSRSRALLLGRLYDDRGHRMTPSFAMKRGVRYRYYVSRAVAEGRNDVAGSMVRVPAIDVEEAVKRSRPSAACGRQANRVSGYSTTRLGGADRRVKDNVPVVHANRHAGERGDRAPLH
jgi:hypothetical protein